MRLFVVADICFVSKAMNLFDAGRSFVQKFLVLINTLLPRVNLPFKYINQIRIFKASFIIR